jgi:hypothetical protein
MGGPWAGRLTLNGTIVPGEYLWDSPHMASGSGKKIVFAKYYLEDELGNRWQFHIQIIDIIARTAIESLAGFNAFKFVSASDVVIDFYQSVDAIAKYRTSLSIGPSTFREVFFDFSFLEAKNTMTISPFRYHLRYEHQNHRIEYYQMNELCQGCPEAGYINIDGEEIEGYRFGTPPVFFKEFVFIPLFERPAFYLASVDLTTREVQKLSGSESLLLIKSVSESQVEYFTDLNNTVLKTVPLRWVEEPV